MTHIPERNADGLFTAYAPIPAREAHHLAQSRVGVNLLPSVVFKAIGEAAGRGETSAFVDAEGMCTIEHFHATVEQLRALGYEVDHGAHVTGNPLEIVVMWGSVFKEWTPPQARTDG